MHSRNDPNNRPSLLHRRDVADGKNRSQSIDSQTSAVQKDFSNHPITQTDTDTETLVQWLSSTYNWSVSRTLSVFLHSL